MRMSRPLFVGSYLQVNEKEGKFATNDGNLFDRHIDIKFKY